MQKILYPILLFCFFACGGDATINPALIGTWHGAAWLQEGKAMNTDASQVQFVFNADGTFEASFGKQKEKGSFYTEAEKLYTKADGQLKKMVRIQKLNADTLQFQMNRTGTEEVMILVK